MPRGFRRTAIEKSEEERIFRKYQGKCGRGKCGKGELACKDLENNFYTCVCPHDSKAPLTDGSCPRFTVPFKPGLIRNVLPPLNIIPRTNDDQENGTLTDTTPSVQHSMYEPSTLQNSQLLNTNYYIIGASMCVFLLLFTLISLIVRRKCSTRYDPEALTSPINLKNSLLVSKRYAPNPQYIVCSGSGVPLLRKETLKFLHEIGEGCFGKVYKGEYIAESSDKVEIVAIKVLKENAGKDAEEDFLREVDIMSAFRHSNILSLLGMVPREGNLNPMMVFEYMSHGDLAELLRSQNKSSREEEVPQLKIKDLFHISLQIARGMSYLASQRFVHRDLACRNCLVAPGPIVKIADFGMSRDVYTCDYYKIGGSRLLPVRWMSPESVVYGRFTLESDIWSYGVVLWEIFSFGKQPYYGHTNEEVVKLILDGIMLIPPIDCPSIICELMKYCWKTEPRDRIRFINICDKLEVAYENAVSIEDYDDIGNEKRVYEQIRDARSGPMDKINLCQPLPRPPPIHPFVFDDSVDTEGYLLPKEIKEPTYYLETFSG